MSKLYGSTLSTSNIDPRYTSNPKIKDAIEKLRLAEEKANSANSAKSGDSADTVEISDEARALYNEQNNPTGAGETASSNLFTKAGRAEASERYTRIFESLLAEYGEDEAIRRFDDFMRSEGYEREGVGDTSMTAPTFTATTDRTLSSYSYLNATVMNGEDHILAATWATFSASSASGTHVYLKKISDSFDLAADTRTMVKGSNIYEAENDEYKAQLEELWAEIDSALEEALTTGSLIQSTVSEEEFVTAREDQKDYFNVEVKLESVEKIPDPAKENKYVADSADLKQVLATADRLKAKFKSLKTTTRPQAVHRPRINSQF